MTSIVDQLEREWDHATHAIASHLPHHQHPNPYPETSAPVTPEEPVSLLDEIKTGVADVAAKLEAFDADALGKLEAIQASPEAASLFATLGSVAGIPGLPAGILATAESVLKGMAGLVTAAAPVVPVVPAEVPQAVPEPQAVPAGPQVGGQA